MVFQALKALQARCTRVRCVPPYKARRRAQERAAFVQAVQQVAHGQTVGPAGVQGKPLSLGGYGLAVDGGGS